MTIFYRALGKALSSVDGLRSAYLPSSIGLANALVIAESANSARKASLAEPYAVVVCPSSLQDSSSPLAIQLNETIRYRLGNRLFVFLDSSRALASIDKSIHVLMSDSYPDTAQSPVDLDTLANQISEDVFSECNFDIHSDARFVLQKFIRSLLTTLAELHKFTNSGAANDWNVDWFRHVSAGVENLCEILSQNDSLELSQSEVIESFSYAAFGLPKPKVGTFLKNRESGIHQEFETARAGFWKDESQVEVTLEHLRQKYGLSEPHPVAEVNWSGLDRAVASHDNFLLALLDLASNYDGGFKTFSKFLEEDFFHPLPPNVGGELLVSNVASGELWTIPYIGQANKLGFVLLESEEPDSDGSCRFESDLVYVKIPTLQPISMEELDSSSLKLSISKIRNLEFHGNRVLVDGSLLLEGRFLLGPIKPPYKFINKPAALALKLGPGDSLLGKIDERATGSILLLPNLGSGLLLAEVNASNKYSKLTYLGPVGSPDDDGSYRHELANPEKQHLFLSWTSPFFIEGNQIPAAEGLSEIFAAKLNINSSLDMEIAQDIFKIETPVTELRIESPIHAAAKKALLTREESSLENQQSLFGRLETAMSRILQNECWRNSNLHMVLPSDADLEFGELSEIAAKPSVISSDSTYHAWSSVTNFSVDSDFQKSAQVKEFQDSFDGLDVPSELVRRLSNAGDAPDWASRTSWAHLWSSNRDSLERYLSAFEAMVNAARLTKDPDTIFWASYPFSVSVWDTLTTGKLAAVLLSPLHPLRLGWLASTEWTLRNGDQSEALAGAIEGWNLPSVGPALTINGSTLAIPCDSGVGQLFLGWSVMTPTSSEGFEGPRIPSRIAGVASPGGGASGLNKSSATSALHDYRRINPQVTTMTIDLAASTQTPRLRELDESVLQSISHWAGKEKFEVPGGIRIWDSLNRLGPAPVDEVLGVAGRMSGAPLAWTRYQHVNGQTKKCNVRFLQDSGIKVSVTRSASVDNAKTLGAVGEVPLRRFEMFNGLSSKAGQSESLPALGSKSIQSPYNAALNAFENSVSIPPVVRSQVFRALLVDSNAEWTVSGESIVSPSGIASLLSGDSTSQMLWEWRPPFFDTRGDFSLEKRPFISVARIPDSFKKQVSDLIEKAESRAPKPEEIDLVLSNLGSRGVGLSSLISMGGTHAAGALGFHLALKLLDQLKEPDTHSFIMPIDACDSFLRVLSTEAGAVELRKRADLLILTVGQDGLTLTPVEIKFYGLAASSDLQPKLPSPGDGALTEALTQAFETKALLDLVVSKWSSIVQDSNSASKALWLNALAALLEASVKLSPLKIDNPSDLVENFSKLLQGKMKIGTGKPLVTFFTMNGVSGDGKLAEAHKVSDENGDWGLLSINTAEAFRRVKSDSIDESWIDAASWCTGSDNSQANLPQGNKEIEPVEDDSEEKLNGKNVDPEVTLPNPTDAQDEDTAATEAVLLVPTPANENNVINWANAYPEADGVRVIVGTKGDVNQVEVADYWPANTELTQMNMGVVGDLGTGKTQFLRSLVTQIRQSANKVQKTPVNFLIFDYKRDYRDETFLAAVDGRVLSPDSGIPLNVLALTGEYSKKKAYKRAMAFCDVLDKIYSQVGPVQRNQLTQTIVALFEAHPLHTAPTLNRVVTEYKKAIGKDDAVTSILNKFVLSGVFVEDQGKLETFEELMENRVTIVSLNELGADSDTKNALVVLMLDLYYEYMLTSTKWPFVGEDPQIRTLNSFLLVDEATNIMKYDFPVLNNLLLEGREWGFGVILASQYLSHFKTSNNNYGEPLKTWVIHKVPSVKLAELVQLGLSGADDESVRQVAKLKVHQVLYDSLGFSAETYEGLPFYRLGIPANDLKVGLSKDEG